MRHAVWRLNRNTTKLCKGPGTQNFESWLDEWVITFTEVIALLRPLDPDQCGIIRTKEPSFADAHLVLLKHLGSDDLHVRGFSPAPSPAAAPRTKLRRDRINFPKQSQFNRRFISRKTRPNTVQALFVRRDTLVFRLRISGIGEAPSRREGRFCEAEESQRSSQGYAHHGIDAQIASEVQRQGQRQDINPTRQVGRCEP